MITNETKHIGLDKKDLRDFVGKTLQQYHHFYEKQEDVLKEIETLKNKLKEIKIRDGLMELMKQLNWKDYDVSDYIDYKFETYFNFIGTDDEYNKLINTLKLIKEQNKELVNKKK
jgi:ribonucleotide reductase beta subunit family protein with ferritin-like domain